MLEIEAKLKVDSHDGLDGLLKGLGAVFVGNFRQVDTYFDSSEDSLVKSDRGLRIRVQVNGKSQKVLLTYKGPKQDGAFKSRQEIEVELGDHSSMQEILQAIGLEKKLMFEKIRHQWKFDGCVVCLDELPLLGCFVEVEGPDEKTISKVLGQLKISGNGHVAQTYSRLIAERLAESGDGKIEAFF